MVLIALIVAKTSLNLLNVHKTSKITNESTRSVTSVTCANDERNFKNERGGTTCISFIRSYLARARKHDGIDLKEFQVCLEVKNATIQLELGKFSIPRYISAKLNNCCSPILNNVIYVVVYHTCFHSSLNHSSSILQKIHIDTLIVR